MNLDLTSIANPKVAFFYRMYWPQRQIVRDFYERLTDERYDFRLVDTPSRHSDSPRESLAHLIYVQLVYLNGLRRGRLEFRSQGVEHFWRLSRAELLAEMDRVESEMFAYLAASDFDAEAPVAVPWGGTMGALDLLYFLRDHDILHVGWNLALMDCLDIPRFPSLIQYWGP